MQPDWRLVGRDQEAAAIIERLGEGVGTVILGVAGIGKTTLAREVGKRLREQGQPPLFVGGGNVGGTQLPTVIDVADAAAAVMIVDDVHLLDTSAARMLMQLVATTGTRIIATARSGDAPLYSIGWLWTAGACERLELKPLGGDDMWQLLEQQLGGQVDEELVRTLSEQARGNPLLLGHLLRSGVQSGALARDRGVWRLVGQLPLTTAVADVIRSELAGISADQLQAMQMLTLAQPMRLSTAQRIATLHDLETLESRRLIAINTGPGEPTVSCAHPLYGELLRGEIGLLRSRRLQGQLLQAMGADPAASDRERLLAAAWRLDLGEDVEIEELLSCARLANTENPALAEKLLRRALRENHAGTATVEASTMLAQLLLLQGRVAEADRVIDAVQARLAEIVPTLDSDPHHESLSTVRVLIRTRLGEITEALSLLGAAPSSDDTGLHVQALHAQLMLLSARLDEALSITEPLVLKPADEPDAAGEPVARAVAAYTVVTAYSFAGRIGDTDAALQRAVPLLAATRDALPYGMALAQVSTAIAKIFAGHLGAAARLGQRMADIAQHDDDQWQRPRSATVLGLLALYRGQTDTAIGHLQAAISVLSPLDAMFLRYNLAFLARAAALTGNLTQAQQALQPPADAPQFPLYEADWQIAEAAVLAAHDHLDQAAHQAMTAAHTAAGHGQWGIAGIAAHDAARYTSPDAAAAFLTTAADLSDGPLPPLMRQHAIARTTGDHDQLQRVSLEFERLGLTLFAAEAAYAAAHHLHRAGDQPAASRQATRATDLHGRCEHAYLPWTIGQAAHDLTTRERHVALLAASGRTDRDISNQLNISIRTTQTHLTHAYTKLQISNRTELALALITD